MTDLAKNSTSVPEAAAGPKLGSAAPQKPPVYVHFFRMIGMPNFRFRLPSRNWTIFLTIVGSWTAAYLYDRREKKQIIQKWCDRVSHLSRKALPPDVMPRSITIVLSAPPADGLLTAREHFHEYIKPILVAGAMDWDAIEGRKEGDVRAMVAERIREFRLRAGEKGELPERDGMDADRETIRQMRLQHGLTSENSQSCAGDIVVGRNTWKEYIRGLHEGWLGPLRLPNELDESEQVKDTTDSHSQDKGKKNDSVVAPVEASSPVQENKAEDEKKTDKAKRKQPPAFIETRDYPSAALPPTITQRLGPCVTVPIFHLLGFLNTPIRMYRFLQQRHLADEIGQQVAAAVLASYESYQHHISTNAAGPAPDASGTTQTVPASTSPQWEQAFLLKQEEEGWHKSIYKEAGKLREQGKEAVWADAMILDPRIASRMTKFALSDHDGDLSAS